MELTQLMQFFTVAKFESISKASEELYVSPPALTKSIQKLETELGVPLFERNKGRLYLNDYGRILYDACGDIKGRLSQVISDMELIKNGVRTIRISTSIAAIRYLVLSLWKTNPEISIELEYGADNVCRQRLLDGECDLVFTFSPMKEDGVHSFPFTESRGLIVGPESENAGKDKMSMSDLNGKPMLIIKQLPVKPGHEQMGTRLLNYLQNNDIHPVFRQVSDMDLFRCMLDVEGCKYYSFTSTFAAKFQDKTPGMKYLEISDAIIRETYFACYKDIQYEKISPLLDWIRDNFLYLQRG